MSRFELATSPLKKPKITRRPIYFAGGVILLIIIVFGLSLSLKGSTQVANINSPVASKYSQANRQELIPVFDPASVPGGILPSADTSAADKHNSPEDEQDSQQAEKNALRGLIEAADGVSESLVGAHPEKSLTSDTQVYALHDINVLAEHVRARPNVPSLVQEDPTTLGASLQPVAQLYNSMLPKGDTTEVQNKEAFLSKKQDEFVLENNLQAPSSKLVVTAGSLIPAIMKEAIVSDLPGEVRAQVSQAVYDSPTGRAVVIPQGATLFGRYDADVIYGQNRLLVAWHRLTFPDGSSLNLDVMSGADSAGAQGFHDEVHNHYGRIFGSATLLSIISAGVQLSQPQQSVLQQQNAGQTAAAALGQNLGQVATQLVNKNLNIKPTILVKAGYRFVVKVNKDMRFKEPYLE